MLNKRISSTRSASHGVFRHRIINGSSTADKVNAKIFVDL